jgi:hypothetical protein
MQILILGEGPTDLGRLALDGTLETEGTLPILVRKILNAVAPELPIDVRAQQISKKPRLFPASARRMGRSQYGYANRLWGLLGLKEGRDADAIVAVVDRDGKQNKDRIEELNKGRQELSSENKACAVGVAIEMIEAWLLADEKALRDALSDATMQRQPDPESLKDPKGKLREILTGAVSREIQTGDFPDHYAAIAKAVAVAVLEQRCPEGFGPFAEQVRALETFKR